jgi:hypothetical protein
MEHEHGRYFQSFKFNMHNSGMCYVVSTRIIICCICFPPNFCTRE